MATIQKYATKNNLTRWRVRWVDENGQQKSKSFNRQKLASEYLINLEHSMKQGIYVTPSKTTVGQFLDEWFSIHKKKIEYNTVIGYEYNIKHAKEHIGNISLQSLKASDIEKMYGNLNLSGKSKQYIHTTINTALKYAVKNKLISHNPCDIVDRPKKQKFQANFIKPDKIKDYVSLFEGTWIYPAVVISIFCGLRRGELSALKWSDINFKTLKLTVNSSSVVKKDPLTKKKEITQKKPKNNQVRTISLPPSVAVILKKHRTTQSKNKLLMGNEYFDSDYVIREDNGIRPKPEYISRFFSRYIKRSKLPHVRFHDLRHTMGSLMIYEGVNIKTVSDILGHSSIAITGDIYAHIIEEQKREAANKIGKYLH